MDTGETDKVPGVSRVTRGALALAGWVDFAVTHLCRFIVLASGIALALVMTSNVATRYLFASGGFAASQELPERLFPWFIGAGIVLAAQAGGHMAVDWLLEMQRERGRRLLLVFGNLIVIGAYGVLFKQAMAVAEIASIEKSPVLGLSGSHGYWAIALSCVLLVLVHFTASMRILLLGSSHRFTLTYKEI
jgi:TRAP-type transport system small permease protein